MSVALNIMLLIICVNLFLYLGYKAELIGTCVRSSTLCGLSNTTALPPAINLISKIAGDSKVSWTDVVCQVATESFTSSTLTLIGIIIGVIIALSLATGSLNVSLLGIGGGGSGYGAVHALTIIAIVIFMTFIALPNFSCLFPNMEEIAFILKIIFGSFIVVSVFGIMRGE